MKTLLFALLGALGAPALAASLSLAAASDLTYCMDDLATAFKRVEPGAEVKVSIGSSGNLFAQIGHGAPFDVFLSADTAYPARLAAEGSAVASTQFTYALGQAVVWSLDARLDVQQGMGVFRDARIGKVAIANPHVAPYRRAPRAALQHYGVWDAVRPKLVIGENIAQTAQFVQTGNAQVGIVSLATVVSPRMKGVGKYYAIPVDGLAPIEQAAIVTRAGKDNPLAARFMQFLRSPAAKVILQRSGFRQPPQ
jgi:molybdate transport system substrate-binding protein